MDVAVREAGLAPHVRCFAHILNLASQAGLNVPLVSHFLGRIRRIVALFYRSSTAKAALAAKQITSVNHQCRLSGETQKVTNMECLGSAVFPYSSRAVPFSSSRIFCLFRFRSRGSVPAWLHTAFEGPKGGLAPYRCLQLYFIQHYYFSQKVLLLH